MTTSEKNSKPLTQRYSHELKQPIAPIAIPVDETEIPQPLEKPEIVPLPLEYVKQKKYDCYIDRYNLIDLFNSLKLTLENQPDNLMILFKKIEENIKENLLIEGGKKIINKYFINYILKNNEKDNNCLLRSLIKRRFDELASIMIEMIITKDNTRLFFNKIIDFSLVIDDFTILYLACFYNMPKTALKIIELGKKSKLKNDKFFIYANFMNRQNINALDFCENYGDDTMNKVKTELTELMEKEKKKEEEEEEKEEKKEKNNKKFLSTFFRTPHRTQRGGLSKHKKRPANRKKKTMKKHRI